MFSQGRQLSEETRLNSVQEPVKSFEGTLGFGGSSIFSFNL